MGWTVDRQQKPESIHTTVTSHHEDKIAGFLDDLRAAIVHVKAHPEDRGKGNAAMYGMMAKVPFRGMVKHSVEKVMESMYGPDALTHPAEPGNDQSGPPLLRALSKYGGVPPGGLHRLGELQTD